MAGYPCQPSSAMRNAHKKKVSPQDHDGHRVAEMLCDAILIQRPRLVLLENTGGIEFMSEYDGINQTGSDWLRSRLSDKYHIQMVKLDLIAWVEMARPRLYIFMAIALACMSSQHGRDS